MLNPMTGLSAVRYSR